MKPSLSVIVPALNEEENIRPAIETIRSSIGDMFSEYEILLFDDGSTDRTGAIADELAKEDNRIRAVHNGTNRGFGYNYRTGVELARKEYIIMLPGDNEISREAIETILDRVGQADIVIPYTANPEVRPFIRRMLSPIFTGILNLLFGLRLKYYNGPVVHKADIIKYVPMTTDGFAYQAEILIRLIKAGKSFTEVGMKLQQRTTGSSKAFKIKNVISVIKTVARLIPDMYWRKG